MKCNFCGFENSEEYKFCQNCGTQLNPAVEQTSFPPKEKESYVSEEQPPIIQSPPTFQPYTGGTFGYAPYNMPPLENNILGKILSALRSGLFLAVCILMSIACGFALGSGSIPVLQVLFTVFLWLCYSGARKGTVNSNSLKCISGTVYASYVVTNVLSGILVVCGIILALIFGAMGSSDLFIDEFASALEESGIAFDIIDALLSVSGVLIGGFFILIAVILLVVNLVCYKRIHKFAKSVYRSAETGQDMLIDAKFTHVFLFVMGIIEAVSSVMVLIFAQNFLGICSSVVSAALMIVCSILIKDKICN